ncbi:hypothetical protein F5148DRAFT_1187768 [Russula earlei]|uniref:Uncharacterized protein n=1 Tax=Russula earlei TaxID=71964 RepID=A0ACC0UDS7_9AGAM|nr:hypothetical protein F5148DRAFT_1187768 [Russula earlei]
MRTSAVVAFICLAMGVAPSFSLPSISVGANLSKRSQPPHDKDSPSRLPEDRMPSYEELWKVFEPFDFQDPSRNVNGYGDANRVHPNRVRPNVNRNVNGRGIPSSTREG